MRTRAGRILECTLSIRLNDTDQHDHRFREFCRRIETLIPQTLVNAPFHEVRWNLLILKDCRVMLSDGLMNHVDMHTSLPFPHHVMIALVCDVALIPL